MTETTHDLKPESRCPFNLGCKDDGEPCAHEDALAKAYDRGHRDARMAIDEVLQDPGRGSLADLQRAIKQLMRRSAMGHAFRPAGGLAGPRACGVVVHKPEGERLCCLPEWAHEAPKPEAPKPGRWAFLCRLFGRHWTDLVWTSVGNGQFQCRCCHTVTSYVTVGAGEA